MAIPADYEERVYAGVLGKIIGVYLGKPFEGWTCERITAELGEITGYVHEKFGRSIVELDDDIAGTFAFVRAMADYGSGRDITADEIGRTWLNCLIEGRTVLWWGGLGTSTEHTAYLRLKSGLTAPDSGSIEVNGPVVAQQIGGQIFIDGWGMVAPGDPELAAELAREAASASHDGEGIYGAQVVAAMEALAFVEADINRLLDIAVSFIPKDSHIYRLIGELRELHGGQPDWRGAREWLAAEYPYARFGGSCPMVPNHGLIILALLYGGGNFAKSLMIVNTSGWDTDCNSGNLGCLLCIRDGLAAFDADGIDWRGPVADRLYVPTADAGGGVTDAVIETYRIVNSGRALAGLDAVTPKGGARFHFEFPGALQGFAVEPRGAAAVALENVEGHSRLGKRALAIRYRKLGTARVSTPTFARPEEFQDFGYRMVASPTLYAGQTVRAGVQADAENESPVTCRLTVDVFGADDELVVMQGGEVSLEPGGDRELTWRVPDTKGSPIADVGIELASDAGADGVAYLDYLRWDGAPNVVLGAAERGGTMWQRAWVNGADTVSFGRGDRTYRICQNRGTGLLIQGTREWTDYRASTSIRVNLAASAGLAARVGGMRRYYALLLVKEGVQLVKAFDELTVLAETDLTWEFGGTHELALEVVGGQIKAWVDSRQMFDVTDNERPLAGGAVALVVEEGSFSADSVTICPADQT